MQQLAVFQELINKSINETSYRKYPHELYEPLDYMMSLGGKRMRPVLALIGYSLFADEYEKALPAALSVETFHNFSLIHDDIMDEAPIRRGQSTVHEKWNHNTAILSGDVMLVKAYELLSNYPANLLPDLFKVFNQTAVEVCEGQQIDMQFEQQDNVSVDEYLKMIELKTAVLLGCSLKMGAIVAGASEQDRDAVYEFGRLMGVAFQLRDDYLDVYADPSKFGKQVGGDIISNKKTFMLIQALKTADDQQLSLIKLWMGKEVFNAEEKVKIITQLYNDLRVNELILNKIDEYAKMAFDHLEKITGKTEAKETLISLSKDLLIREV